MTKDPSGLISPAAGEKSEISRLARELEEARAQQRATSDILQAITSFAGELEPVFQAILANAAQLCEANFGTLTLNERDTFRVVALHNVPEAFAELRRHKPTVRFGPKHPLARQIATKQVLHIADVKNEPAYLEGDPRFVRFVDLAGPRTLLNVPMLKANEVIGTIGIYRKEVRPFAHEQIELLENFAAQAVIAIENARLLSELRQSLEQQMATSEVLQVVSSSPDDLQPVFAAMLEKAVRICDALFGTIQNWDGESFRRVATHNTPPALAEARKHLPNLPSSPQTPLGRLLASKGVVHIADLAVEPGYLDQRIPAVVASVELGGVRTSLLVPMLKENEVIGAFILSRQEVRPFTDKQIALVTNFAAQAVIAIENARLLNELRQRTTDLTEALEQQTATSEVLSVISSFPGDLEPVFDAMLEKAARICDATFGIIYRWDGDALQLVGTHNTPPAFAEARRRSPIRPNPKGFLVHVLEAKMVHVADLAAEPIYTQERDPTIVAGVELGGIRTLLVVPMLKESELIGVFSLYRQEVRPFTDKQIELVKNFAAQAVIAIENARLLNELRESLEEQTATSDVLRVISSSAGDLEPVFDAMLEKAVRICDASFGAIYNWDGAVLLLAATHNSQPAFAAELRKYGPRRPDAQGPVAHMVATKKAIQVPDLAAEAGYTEQRNPLTVAAVELAGTRTILFVPMLKEGELVGSFHIARTEVRLFTDKEMKLVENFAAQAVIAIENARLLNELRERTGEVEKLNQQLERRVADQVGEIERMGRLRRFLPPQVADLIVASGMEKQLESHRREITALFCDLRGFTGFSESSDPEDVMALLRDYHAAIGEIIIKYSGTLERYAGDGVMVIFNDPVPVENPALQAVLMALEMRDAIGALTDKWRRLGHDIGFGIGIAHGFATLGTIGFEGRFDYAAIGTVSNVASRLCDEAKPGQILITPRVLMAVENAVNIEPVGEFALKGIRRPLAAYNVLAALS